ncbi:MAG TPA: DinB family protein [Thermoanaerobaculia bacterium]
MDEYERAGEELARLILRLSDAEFEAVWDLQTKDEDCRSIQTVMHHVVTSGYSYALYLREALSEPGTRPQIQFGKRTESVEQLEAMLAYTAATLEGRWEMPNEQTTAARIQSRWGQAYNLEQMLEHAIVHILRHRRQIERFLRA